MHEQESGIEYKVGLLMVGAAALFAAFIFVLGHFSFRGGFTMYVDYDYSGNVQTGAPVKVSGITVGRVESVDFMGGQIDPETKRRVQVRVEIWVEDRAHDSIRRDAEFFINTAGVLGEQYVEIVPGKDWEAPRLPAGSIIVGVTPPRTDLVVARLYELLDLMSGVMRQHKDEIAHILTHAAEAVDQVDGLLVENHARVASLLDSVTQLAGQGTKVLAKVDGGLDSSKLSKAVTDADNLIVSVDHAVTATAPDASSLLKEGVRVLGLATPDRVDHALTAVDRAGKAADEAGTLLHNANGIVTDLRAGKGSIGALLERLDVYADVREMVRDLKNNPWKLLWKE